MYKIIGRILVGLCMSVFMGSCVLDIPEGMEGDELIDKNTAVLHLNIKSLEMTTTDNPVEKIKSLRVIIVGKGEDKNPDIIECNTLVNVPNMTAQDYSYVFRWNSKPGKKDIYVLANESSVSEDFSTEIAKFREQTEAGTFSDWLNDYHFNPEYNVDSKNNIYLPYSYSYEGLEPKAGVVNTVNAWLVPVAAKFIFNFTNKRTNPVKVNGIYMSSANESNYLLAHLGSLTKEYNGEMLYWADWLAEVSRKSWDYPGFGANEDYNREVGWISDYYLPSPEDSKVYTFVESEVNDFTIPGATKTEEDGVETVTPQQHSTQIYYLPESINYIISDSETPGDDQTGDSDNLKEQRFYLTLLLEDTGTSTAPEFNNVAIPNLQALFRNTYVIINISMSDGDIEVYAEIAYWNKKTANGWVNEGNAPSNNPFRIRNKW